MGRSVSYATGSTAIAYRSFDCEDEFDSEFEFDYLIDWIRETAKTAWPSMTDCDSWLGREDHAILCNDLAYIGVSEYCGLVSVWLVDRENDHGDSFYYGEGTLNLCKPWCAQIAPRFHELFGEYRKIGTASNGESFFQKV